MDFDAFSEEERILFMMEIAHEAIRDAGRLILVRDICEDLPSRDDDTEFELGIVDDTSYGFTF